MSAAAPAAPTVTVYRRQTPTVWQAIGRSIWQSMQAVGQRRAARELRAMAQRWEPFDAALAQQLREAAQHDTRSARQNP